MNCIVWFDGEKWQACIDDSFTNNFPNLEKLKVLTNFDNEQEIFYDPKSDKGFTVSEDGNSMQILYPFEDHATIVTHIAAANFPHNPESNGLAPGAQIISMNVLKIEEAVKNYI
uniref:Peptidase S8/S53 domain-containing protein n=1 Tax=Panagrolaimus sp. ES5 TaxID=591445 RepID=A0AC34FSG5_9BILA